MSTLESRKPIEQIQDNIIHMAFCKRFRVTWTVSFIQSHGGRLLPKKPSGHCSKQHTSVSLFFLGTHLDYISQSPL